MIKTPGDVICKYDRGIKETIYILGLGKWPNPPCMRPHTHVLVAIPSQLHVLYTIPSHLHVLGAIPRKVGANVDASCVLFSIQTELHLQFDKSAQNGTQLVPSLAPSLS